MADLIERSEIVKVAEHAYHEWELAMGAAENSRQVNRCYKMQELCKAVKAVAEAAPTVDAVPVIRCRDCKHLYMFLDGKCVCCLRGNEFAIKRDDFCSYAEPVEKPVESVDSLGGKNNE